MDVLQKARDLYQKGEMHDALEAAQIACERQPKDAEAWWLLGCVSRYTQMPAASETAFQRAAELSRKKVRPHRLSQPEFESMVQAVLGGLSPDALRRLKNARVEVDGLPSIESIRAGLPPDALSSRHREAGDRLTIYQINHENRAASESELRGLLARTLSRA